LVDPTQRECVATGVETAHRRATLCGRQCKEEEEADDKDEPVEKRKQRNVKRKRRSHSRKDEDKAKLRVAANCQLLIATLHYKSITTKLFDFE